ncbi:hypothetical protein MHFGQ_11790 [Moorella humiferrea]|uniref:Preprotein translocase subunit SecA n=1 Tax=Neomoorella humiferrea TaxID=676965 RepID=A0A2T0AQN7_9FIRM|nr:hypothetical protein MOHU_16260 [Moorella humiferrea]
MKSCLDGRKPSFVVEKVKGMLQRNDDCPCGSGRKYKKCCLSRVEEANRLLNQVVGPGTYTTTGRKILATLGFMCGLSMGEGGTYPNPARIGRGFERSLGRRGGVRCRREGLAACAVRTFQEASHCQRIFAHYPGPGLFTELIPWTYPSTMKATPMMN